MAKTITITDIRINAIWIVRDDDNNITFTADYQWMDGGSVIPGVNLQVNSEERPLTEFPADIRTALVTINNYATARIKSAEGV